MTTTRTIAVLGANSFSGQDFVDLLLDDPRNRVLGISRSALRSAVFIAPRLRESESAFQYRQLEMNRQMPELLAALDEFRPQWIVNFAAQSEVGPSWNHPEQWFQTNCVALAEMINHLRGCNYLERYLHISSPEVYGTCHGTVTESAEMNPSTPYAASKAGADFLLESYRRHLDFPLLTVRATNVYGARQQLHKIIPRSAIYMAIGKRISLHGGGESVKSYIHIRDVSRGELAVLERGEIGGLYHLSPDSGIAVRDVVRSLCGIIGKDFGAVTETVGERLGQDAAYVIDSTRARTELGWSPTISIEEGLNEVVQWVDANLAEIRTLPLDYQHQQ